MFVLVFVLLVNLFMFAAIYLTEWLTAWFSISFINDYFFYSAIIQWLVASFFMFSTKERNSVSKSPSMAVKKTASMVSYLPSVDSLTSISDRTLGYRLLLSGVVSLVICFVI